MIVAVALSGCGTSVSSSASDPTQNPTTAPATEATTEASPLSCPGDRIVAEALINTTKPGDSADALEGRARKIFDSSEREKTKQLAKKKIKQKTEKTKGGHSETILSFLDESDVTVGVVTFTEIQGSWYFEGFTTCN